MKQHKRMWKVISAGTIAVLWICFIFGNSLQIGDNSGALSGTIVEFLMDIMPNLATWFTSDQIHFLLRKLAHFSEYAILGLWLWIFWLQIVKIQIKKISRTKFQAQGRQELWSKIEYRAIIGQTLTLGMTTGLLTALSDETIQTFVPERAGQVADVWIDFAGILAMQLILASISYILNKRKLVGK